MTPSAVQDQRLPGRAVEKHFSTSEPSFLSKLSTRNSTNYLITFQLTGMKAVGLMAWERTAQLPVWWWWVKGLSGFECGRAESHAGRGVSPGEARRTTSEFSFSWFVRQSNTTRHPASSVRAGPRSPRHTSAQEKADWKWPNDTLYFTPHRVGRFRFKPPSRMQTPLSDSDNASLHMRHPNTAATPSVALQHCSPSSDYIKLLCMKRKWRRKKK